MHGAGTPGVKMEADSEMGNGWIKAEAETSSAMQMDEDIYEDAGDLDFAAASQDLYLTRLPKMLWDSWSQLDNEQEIRLGTVRVEGSLNEVKRVSGPQNSCGTVLIIRLCRCPLCWHRMWPHGQYFLESMC